MKRQKPSITISIQKVDKADRHYTVVESFMVFIHVEILNPIQRTDLQNIHLIGYFPLDEKNMVQYLTWQNETYLTLGLQEV